MLGMLVQCTAVAVFRHDAFITNLDPRRLSAQS